MDDIKNRKKEVIIRKKVISQKVSLVSFSWNFRPNWWMGPVMSLEIQSPRKTDFRVSFIRILHLLRTQFLPLCFCFPVKIPKKILLLFSFRLCSFSSHRTVQLLSGFLGVCHYATIWGAASCPWGNSLNIQSSRKSWSWNRSHTFTPIEVGNSNRLNSSWASQPFWRPPED